MSNGSHEVKRARRLIKVSTMALFSVIAVVLLVTIISTAVEVHGRQPAPSGEVTGQAVKEYTPEQAKVLGWGFLAAAFSAGLGCVGAGIAVGYVGAAALGVIGERPELTAKALIYVGLAEGIAIYGLIIAIMVLMRL
ncbi:MAG: hypothetical protein B6D63_07325 [Candidatus Latescibacteria bacterium 4484_7]|nr:MAG: hypothetical protein B6D63_07325 [Candidatus Latescibacteria bacterium 4484_7]RKZ08239.1 MAG: ATPase [bacterium]